MSTGSEEQPSVVPADSQDASVVGPRAVADAFGLLLRSIRDDNQQSKATILTTIIGALVFVGAFAMEAFAPETLGTPEYIATLISGVSALAVGPAANAMSDASNRKMVATLTEGERAAARSRRRARSST